MTRRARVLGIRGPGASKSAVRVAMLGIIAALLGPLATTGAEAASFYTRKRVNGVWITGQFAKGGTSTSFRRHRRVARAPVVEAAEREPTPLPPSAAGEGLVRDGGPETTSAMPRTLASLAEPFPEPVVSDERLARLKEALKAHATGLVARAADPDPAKADPGKADAVKTDAGKVTALSLVGTAEAAPARPPEAAPVAPVASVPANAAALAPRSVSYDFETGIKTTVFANSVVREPFDVAAMKALTPRPPAR